MKPILIWREKRNTFDFWFNLQMKRKEKSRFLFLEIQKIRKKSSGLTEFGENPDVVPTVGQFWQTPLANFIIKFEFWGGF